MGEGEGNGIIMVLASLSHSALCLRVTRVGPCVRPDAGEGEGTVMLLQLSAAPRGILYMFADCERWRSKMLRRKPGDLASLAEGQCAYGPFCLPHMEPT